MIITYHGLTNILNFILKVFYYKVIPVELRRNLMKIKYAPNMNKEKYKFHIWIWGIIHARSDGLKNFNF